jgi:hypothetical protein
MEIENIMAKSGYTKADGTEKVYWNQVGILKTTDQGKRFVELFQHPGTTFYVFKRKEKNENQEQTVEL